MAPGVCQRDSEPTNTHVLIPQKAASLLEVGARRSKKLNEFIQELFQLVEPRIKEDLKAAVSQAVI